MSNGSAPKSEIPCLSVTCPHPACNSLLKQAGVSIAQLQGQQQVVKAEQEYQLALLQQKDQDIENLKGQLETTEKALETSRKQNTDLGVSLETKSTRIKELERISKNQSADTNATAAAINEVKTLKQQLAEAIQRTTSTEHRLKLETDKINRKSNLMIDDISKQNQQDLEQEFGRHMKQCEETMVYGIQDAFHEMSGAGVGYIDENAGRLRTRIRGVFEKNVSIRGQAFGPGYSGESTGAGSDESTAAANNRGQPTSQGEQRVAIRSTREALVADNAQQNTRAAFDQEVAVAEIPKLRRPQSPVEEIPNKRPKIDRRASGETADIRRPDTSYAGKSRINRSRDPRLSASRG